MKYTEIKTAKTITIIMFVICLFTIVSCGQDMCPTYMNSMERVKSMRSQDSTYKNDPGTIPSPYNKKYKSQVLDKYTGQVMSEKKAGRI